MKRYHDGPKDWDINFEGVAHYGMMPDLLQDMTNVGLEAANLNPMFHSAEDFAQMWTKSLKAANAINHPVISMPADPLLKDGVVNLVWFGEEGDVLQVSDNIGNSPNWRTADADLHLDNDYVQATVRVAPGATSQFYRVVKH